MKLPNLQSNLTKWKRVASKSRNRLGLAGVTVVAISLGFASCSIFGRSKSRQYSVTQKESEAGGRQDSATSNPLYATKRADVRPLRSHQVKTLVEEAFGLTLSSDVFDDKLALTLSGEFKEPTAEGAFEPSRLEAISEIAVLLSSYLMEKSPLVQEILAGCSSAEPCARAVYDRFAPVVLKFPLLQESSDVFLQGLDVSLPKDQAVRQTLARLLASPRLWNLVSVPDPANANDASPETVRWRTSLFAWNGSPGGEGSPIGSAATFEDARYDGVWQEFVARWLGLDVLEQQVKNGELYPSALVTNPSAFREEIVANAARILRENRDIRSLLHSEDWIIPDTLKDHYAVQGPDASQGASQRRTGYLSSAAFAAITSGPYSSKTTSRGHFVIKKFLCTEVPPPPSGAGVIPEELASREVTAREKAEIHAKVEPCATCHRLMDPIGFLLEPLNPVGRFRSDYGALNSAGFKYGPTPINPVVSMALGRDTEKVTYQSIEELGRKLASEDKVAACIVQKFVQFATGGSDRETDRREIQAILRQFSGEPLSPRKLGYLVTQLPSFRGMESGLGKSE